MEKEEMEAKEAKGAKGAKGAKDAKEDEEDKVEKGAKEAKGEKGEMENEKKTPAHPFLPYIIVQDVVAVDCFEDVHASVDRDGWPERVPDNALDVSFGIWTFSSQAYVRHT